MSKMSRTEMLCRRLIKHYNLTMKIDSSFMELKPRGPGTYWSDPCVYVADIHAWRSILFGKGRDPRSLTNFIRHMANHWKPCRDRVPLLLDFKTLDELDIQLTLAGANHD